MTRDPFLEPHFRQAALVTIDVQRDTLDGAAVEIPGTSAVLPRIRALTDLFRERGLPVVHMVRLYREDGSNVDLSRRAAVRGGARMFLAGTPGSQLADGLAPTGHPLEPDRLLRGEPQQLGPHEVVMYKPRWGAFFQTPLQPHLEALSVDTIVFCGANFPNCPRTSIYEASERDYRIVVAGDALSRISRQGAEELGSIGVQMCDVSSLRTQLTTSLEPSRT